MSCWSTSNTAYKTISGTSMAAPHVSGLLALMTAKNKMTPAQAKSAIINSCVTSGLGDPHQNCGGNTFEIFHNSMYGNGRIDCMKALQALASDTKENNGTENDVGKENDVRKENVVEKENDVGKENNVGKESGVEEKEKKLNKANTSSSSSKKTRVHHVDVVFTTNV